jgi:hypothetical protein
MHGEMKNVYSMLIGKPEGKKQLGRSRRRWEDNIIMDLREIESDLWTGYIWLTTGTSGVLM